jgi:4-oxalocrotonate tautomerase
MAISDRLAASIFPIATLPPLQRHSSQSKSNPIVHLREQDFATANAVARLAPANFVRYEDFAARNERRVLMIRMGENMPEVIVYAVEGRSDAQKKGLMKDITDAVVKNFGAKPEVVTVQIVESSKTSKAKGGVPFSER